MFAAFPKKSGLALMMCLALAACKSSEERAAEHYENGLRLVAEGDVERALVEFRNTLKFTDGRSIEAQRAIGEISLNKGSLGAAYRNYNRIAEQLPDDVETQLILGQLAFQLQSWNELEKHAANIQRLAPDNLEGQALSIAVGYREAVLAEDRPRRDAMLAQADTLADTLPDDTVLRKIRIDGFAGKGDLDNALLLVNEEIAANPTDLSLRNGKVELLSRLGREAELEAELRLAADDFPEEAEPKNTLMRYLMARGRLDDVETFLRDLVKRVPEERDATYASLVQFLLQTKGADVALADLNAELDKTPDADVLRTLRASINFDLGRKNEAIAEMEAIIGNEDTSLSETERQNIQVTLARMLVNAGNRVGARQMVESVLEANPRSASALKLQAGWMIDEDRTDEAIAALRTALDEEPDDPDTMVIMSEAYKRGGNGDLMLNFLALAVEASNNDPVYTLRYADALVDQEEYLQAESSLISSLRLNPGNIQLLNQLGQVYLRLDDLPRAEQVAETLQNIEDPTAQTRAQALKVNILARNSGTEEAIEFLQDLASKGGEEATGAKLALIRARIQSGDAAQALDEITKMAEAAPDDLRLKNALALTHIAAADYERGAALLEEVVATEPSATASWMHLVRVYSATGQRDMMTDAIERGLLATPGNPDLLWAQASFLQSTGDIDGAIDIYEDLYARFSSFPILANNLASLLTTYRSDPESLERAQVIARRLNGTEVPAFQDTYGWILSLNGSHEAALEYLEPAAAALASDARVQYHLGMAYAGTGQTDKAITQLRKALAEIGPLGDQELADLVRAEIDTLESTAEETSNN